MDISRRDFLRLGALVAAKTALFPVSMASATLAMDPTPTIKPVIPPSADLAYLPAAEQIRRFTAGTLSPVDVLKAQITRIEKYNGPLNTSGKEIQDFMNFNGMVNAITCEYFDEAMAAAKEAEKRYRAGTARSLEGITVAVKDGADVKGWRTTMGTVSLQDAPVERENAAIIDLLLAEGALLHIQTTIPELYIHGQTWSRLWGVTRNPWNLHYAAGGSSGGAGAALAAGFTTMATGSDMGGSIRLPSALCGVYGFRPSFGRVPTSENPYVTNGPMARTFDDMVLMQNAMSGPHPTVHTALRPKLTFPRRYESLRGMHIALDFFGSWISEGIDDSVRKSLEETAKILGVLGAVVHEVDLGWRNKDIFKTYLDGLLATDIGDMLLIAKNNKDKATTYAAHYAEAASSGKGAAESAKADELAATLHRQVQDKVFSKGYKALIMPTLATSHFPADNDPTVDVVMVNGRPVKGIDFVMTYPWNMLNRYPVVDVPVGFADNNVPIGMQVIGDTYDDLAACRVAYAYSQSGLRLYQNGVFPDYRNKA